MALLVPRGARGPRTLRYQRRHLLKTYAFTELGGRGLFGLAHPGFCFGDALRWSVLPVPLHILNFSDASESWRRRRTVVSMSFEEASQLK